MTQPASLGAKPAVGTFAPLAQPTFAVLWVATILGNVGSFMRDVASAWLATDLSSSPAAVATIQAAATLPVFLLAIPAGVLSDILDRRRFLIVIQIGLAGVSGTLAVLAWQQGLTIEILIGLAFLGGIGAAMMGPTWQSIVPELVPANTLRQAVALNALGVNIARAIGPATGGLLLAAFGASVTYGVDLVSYLFVIAALVWWKRPAQAADPLREHFFSAFRAGCALRALIASCMSCWRAPPCISPSAAAYGRCCRWWRANCCTAAPVSTACCWAQWERARSSAR